MKAEIPSVPAVRGRIIRHKQICGICLRTKEERKAIERAFVQWKEPKKIREQYNIDESTWTAHIRFRNLVQRKLNNTEAMYQVIIERGMENENLEIKASDVINALARIDRLQGRDVQKVEIDRPPVVHLHGVPVPGGVRTIEKTAETANEPSQSALPPTFAGFAREVSKDEEKVEKETKERASLLKAAEELKQEKAK